MSTAAPKLTKRQRQYVAFIKGYVRKHRHSPTFRELATAMGVVSTNAVAEVVDALAKHGLVRRRPGRGKRVLELVA